MTWSLVLVSVLKEMGANFIIAVKVIPNVKDETLWLEEAKELKIISIIIHSSYMIHCFSPIG
ncbi:hypothetical protein ACFLTP_04420 [Chloroflexota bacterium]